MTRTIIRTYSELIKLPTYDQRFEYLQLFGNVGDETFGGDRYINQRFYRSEEWRRIRREVIIRDQFCDLAVPFHDISDDCMIVVHHMNPITVDDILNRSKFLLNPEYLITTIESTHKLISYGSKSEVSNPFKPRGPFDTCPWKKERN